VTRTNGKADLGFQAGAAESSSSARRRTDICYVISHGFAARMILHSQLIPELSRRGLKISVLTPGGDEPAMKKLAGNGGFDVLPLTVPAGCRAELSARLRPYIYENVRKNQDLWAKHLQIVKGPDTSGLRRLQSRLFYGINRVAVRLPLLRHGLLMLERWSLRSRRVEEMLQDLQPRLVVSTYPVADLEASVLLTAQRLAIQSVGQLLSWDNITAKGRFLVLPEYFIAWGPIMAEELRKYYGVTDDRIAQAGVAHFDAHINEVSKEDISSHVRSLGLDPQRPYLFFGMSSPVFAPTEIDIVEWLTSKIVQNEFGDDLQLIVRPHPQNLESSMADLSWLGRLEALKSSRIAIDYPILHKSALPWNLDRSDLVKLVNLVGGCRICLNSGSTLSIDAIVQDRPVIVTLFDADEGRPWWRSARRVADYIHQKKMLDLGGARVARSFGDLERAIQAYLKDPELDADGRALVRERELGTCDGRATVRVADALESCLAEGPPLG